MNKKILENKIAELLGVSENEKNLAFSVFKEKLSRFLKVGEALRISELGVFQLKEKLDHSEESKVGGKNSQLTLVYSPITDDPSSDALFVNLEIDKQNNDDTTFNENVFQLGIGKPLVTNITDITTDGNQVKSKAEKIEEDVSLLLENSEKLNGYDLWEDYLERKETKKILDNPEDTDLAIDSIIDESDEESENIDLNAQDEDSILMDDEDVLKDYMNSANFLNDDELDISNDKMRDDDIQIPSFLDESIEIDENLENNNNSEIEISDYVSNTQNIDIENDLINEGVVDKLDEENEDLETLEKLSYNEPDDRDETSMKIEGIEIPDYEEDKKNIVNEDDFKNDSIIEQLDEEIEELEVMKKLSIEEDIYGDDLDELQEDEVFQSNEEKPGEYGDENTNEEINNTTGLVDVGIITPNDEKIADGAQQLKVQNLHSNKPKRKSTVLVLLGAFVIIGAIGIYYIFFNNSSVSKTEVMNEAALIKDKAENKVADKVNLDENSKMDTQDKIANDIIEESESEVENNTSAIEEIPENAAQDESEVSDNIYFDGFVYNVQVSSWRQESIAEKEVNKLVKKGFPAYKVEVYIPKFKGTWYRVRVGPFTSLIEAQESKQKVNK